MKNSQGCCLPPLICGATVFDFTRPYIMGILNVTPDSFSDGNLYYERDKAVDRGIELAEQGADIIDIGGESTRPGSLPIPPEEEMRRVIPVVKELSRRVCVPLSVDTTKACVARRALDAGAVIVNDISALRYDSAMAQVVAQSGAAVILMHMRGTPATMQHNVYYDDLIGEVTAFLEQRIAFAVASGIARDKIIIDPGIGFGKSVEQGNFTLLRNITSFTAFGRPILVGPSRKAFVRALAGDDLENRDWGTAAAVAIAIYNGAHIVRVHDVAHMKIAAHVAAAVRNS
ncbi:MAG: dihydropteroate synthase [Desulfobacterota bacterium]|nr:dihydropteroate synthase [Thermodesulfobacteriota bacterium]